LTETAGVFRTKFHQAEADVAAALRLIGRAATIVRPSVRIMLLEDLPDNRILECAVEAAADLIVTGDHHLLRLRTYQDVAIVRVTDFLRLFPEDPTSPVSVKKKKRGRQRLLHGKRLPISSSSSINQIKSCEAVSIARGGQEPVTLPELPSMGPWTAAGSRPESAIQMVISAA
jgi:hypothetical protein